jgi:hypothetical protein
MPSPNPDSGSHFDPRLVRALDHPVRTSFLKLLVQREAISPAEALPMLDHGKLALSNIVYHARVLEHLELVESTAEATPSGGVSFRATSKGEDALMTLGFCGG